MSGRERISWRGFVDIDPEPRTIRPFEVGRPYVIERATDKALFVVVDHLTEYRAHPAVVSHA